MKKVAIVFRMKVLWYALGAMLVFTLIGCDNGTGAVQPPSPPTWASGYPVAIAIDTNLYVKATLTSSATVYCVVLSDGDTAPTPAQVKNGQDASGNPVAANLIGSGTIGVGGLLTLTITSLPYSTSCDVYCVAQSADALFQTSVTKCDVSTGLRDTLFVSKTGLDSNSGSIEEPKLTIAGAVAARAGSISHIFVSAGTYAESVVLNNCLSLYGGFAATDWSNRDIINRDNSTYKTAIQGASGSNSGVSFSGAGGDPWILEGFSIATNHPGNSYGVSVGINGLATIRYNTIDGGFGINESNGFYIHDSTSRTEVSFNTINVGSVSGEGSSCGIYIETAANQSITHNTIHGGTGTNSSSGIIVTYPLTSASEISNNSIDGGASPSGTSYGIQLRNYNDATAMNVRISNNYIHVANTDLVYGLWVYGSANNRTIAPGIFNNVIEVTSTGVNRQAYGIYLNNADGSPLVYNNTFAVSSPYQSYGIWSSADAADQNSAPDVQNNIFLGESANDCGLLERAFGQFTAIKNNVFYGCEVVIDSDPTPITTIAGLNTLRGVDTVGNIDSNPALSSSPARNLTAASPLAVTRGGVDLSSVPLFPANTSAVKIDKAGNIRTVPWSIGAYERN